ncbi:MAG: DUF58 domain-containing protein [Anaerolineae bacterium]|nr:DUF58 domain-containing protein [Phycisphaerae bacterium]
MARTRRPLNYAPHATVVRRRPSLDFSITGLIYCALMMFMGLAAINSQANLLFGVFGLMFGILLISISISRIVLRRLTMNRGLPESAIVGLPAIITYELRNEKRYWASFSVTVAELDGGEAFTKQPQAYMLHAAPRTAAIIPSQVTPKRRGLHVMDRFQLSTSFPFGFIKRANERKHHESIVIYPALAEVDPKLLQLMRSAESTGATMRPRRGGNDEFYGLKEFRAGENSRYIYWRRSARTGTLVSKEMTHVSPPRIVILVDTFIPQSERKTARHAATERSIAMAASLASHALEQGLTVGLVCWSGEWVKMKPARGKRHRRDVLAVLSRLPLNTQHDSQQLLAAALELQDSGTTLAMFSPIDATAPGSRSAGALIVIPAESLQSRRWFRFNPIVDFNHCMPAEQEPEEEEIR